MSLRAYYNEVEPYAAQWLRNLIAAGLIAAGDVDTRSIVDVQPSDLRGYTRCHFFAGIGVWDYALGLAGWPADRPVWTGSCPCQPFSTAGRRGGTADERHLWPSWYHLICECGPTEVLGEQVASKDGLDWFDLVHSDLDGLGYAFGAADLCAAGVGAPHIRQRSWFVAHADGQSWGLSEQAGRPVYSKAARGSEAGALADPAGERQHGPELGGAAGATARRGTEAGGRRPTRLLEPAGCGAARGMGHADGAGLSARQRPELRRSRPGLEGRAAEQPSRSFWSDAEWLPCRDGKARPVEPGTFPLAHGASARVGRLRAYGNALNAEAARTFIAACLDILPDHEVAA